MALLLLSCYGLGASGYEISPSLYAWLAVLVLPINSALNPVLYTLTTAQFKQQLARFCYSLPCGAHTEYDSAIDSRNSMAQFSHNGSKRLMNRRSKQGHLGTGSTGMLRVPSSLPSSPSTIITNIEQDREERDLPIELAALVVYDQNGPNQNRFNAAAGTVSSYSQSQGQGHMGPTVNCGHRKHRSATAVLMLMERCSNSSTETFDF
uniref:G-protein coupled receptors family 1 profile domain-containing protein n=1 Tax=Anopheles funestus TaxID=62324 RepID=A0A182RNZ9_ANOFN